MNGTVARTETTTQDRIAELRAADLPERLLGLYDLGLRACETRNAEDVAAVIVELVASLDFRYADIAEAFYRLYSYCLEQCRARAFDHVAFVLTDLRRALEDAEAETHAAVVVSADAATASHTVPA